VIWSTGAAVVIVAVIVGWMATTTSSSIPTINQDENHVAIYGYDTVAYFTESKPTKGSAEFSSSWEDATWHFASSANRDLFEANPERYAPQYGGYCAGGLAAGEFAPIDPNSWTIVEGKLYLNKTKELRDSWRSAPQAHIALANYNWSQNRDQLRDNL
jgi:YHS domain-containing protein